MPRRLRRSGNAAASRKSLFDSPAGGEGPLSGSPILGLNRVVWSSAARAPKGLVSTPIRVTRLAGIGRRATHTPCVACRSAMEACSACSTRRRCSAAPERNSVPITLLRFVTRHRHVGVPDVALGFPFPIRLLRHAHPLAVVKLLTVGTGYLESSRGVSQIAAGFG